MDNLLTISSDEIIESPQSPARMGFLRLPLSPVEEDSPDRRPRVAILWDTRATPLRENDRMVGSNNRKQKSSSEIQHISKKIKRHHSSPLLKSKKFNEIDQATQSQRLEDFRKLLMNTDNNKREGGVAKEVKLQTDSFEMDMDEWDNIEAEAEKDLCQPKPEKNLLNETDDLEDFLLGIPSEILNGEVIPDEPITIKLEPQVKIKQVTKAKTDDMLPTTSVNSNLLPKKSGDDDMRGESSKAQIAKQPFASKDEIERKRLEALRRREELMKKSKNEASTSGTSSSNKIPNASLETTEEINKRIERNKQEALRRLQQNTKITIPVKCPQEISNNSLQPPKELIEHKEEIKKSIAASVSSVNIPLKNTSEISEEIRQQIELKRLEALRRLQQKGKVPAAVVSEILQIDSNTKASSINKISEVQPESSNKSAEKSQAARDDKSTVINKIEPPKESKETSEEIRQKIEKNRQEALRRLQEKNKIPPAKVETTSKVSNPTVNPSLFSAGSSTSLSEDAKRQIEEKRLEALKRKELWLKNLNNKKTG